MAEGQLYITLAIIFSFIMAWGVGANDVANAMGTSVGSKALSIKQAIIIAGIFEALGSLFAGSAVTDTIRGKIIATHFMVSTPELMVFGMLASLLAAGTWLILASYFGWPVSTTHSIIGAVIGFGVIVFGPAAINWSQVGNIALSWIVTPIIAGVLAFLLFRSVQNYIFNSAHPIRSAKICVPIYVFLTASTLTLVTFLKGLKHVGLHLTEDQDVLIALIFSAIIALGSYIWLQKKSIVTTSNQDWHEDFKALEKVFAVLMMFTACAMAFAHGSNDVANAIGPLAAVIAIVKNNGDMTANTYIPFWVMCLGAGGIVLGLAMYGHKVIATVGSEITQLTPSRGFAAQLATASTVVISSGLGLPISTTQTLVGAVLGVGFARGMGALNLSVIRNIFMSWIITLPAGAIFAIIYFHLLEAIFRHAY